VTLDEYVMSGGRRMPRVAVVGAELAGLEV
jgi:hypothetical protein